MVDCTKNSEIPLLLGAMTPSECIKPLGNGYSYLKFFPAASAGGITFVQALASPFPEIQFCPTGGILKNNAAQWLELPNVFCIGSPWISPKQLIAIYDWDAISALAQATSQLLSQPTKARSTI